MTTRQRGQGSYTIRFKKNRVGECSETSFLEAQTKRRQYKAIKDGVTPRFSEMTKEYQEYARSLVATTMGVTSKSLSAVLALSPRQIGQIKRRLQETEDDIVRLS